MPRRWPTKRVLMDDLGREKCRCDIIIRLDSQGGGGTVVGVFYIVDFIT